jgi:hypothetical protein
MCRCRIGYLLAGDDVLALVDVDDAVVAIGVAQADGGFDGDAHAAAAASVDVLGGAAGSPPVLLYRVTRVTVPSVMA